MPLVISEWNVTYREIKASLGIGMTNQNNLTWLSALENTVFVGYSRGDPKKETRFKWCKEMLKKYDHSRSRVYNIVISNESWIYCYESKRQSSVSMFSKGPSNKSESRSVRKKMITSFFRKTYCVYRVWKSSYD